VLQELLDEPIPFTRIGSYGRVEEGKPSPSGEAREVGDSVEDRLRALGYLQDQEIAHLCCTGAPIIVLPG
jgi:hypothetical protein